MAYESQGGTWREMITKETFVKALQLIQEQQEINHQFAKALDLVGDGHYVFGVNNKFYDAAMLVLKEAVNDKYDYRQTVCSPLIRFRIYPLSACPSLLISPKNSGIKG